MRKTGVVVVAGCLTFLSAAVAQPPGVCAEPEQVRSSPAWKAFISTLEDYYLAPQGLAPTDLSVNTLGKIMGHALGRQARYVGDDAQRRATFACIELGIEQGLGQAHQIYETVLGFSGATGGSENPSRLVQEAAIGFFDEEIVALTGVGTDQSIPSIFSGETGMVGGAASTSGGSDPKREVPSAHRLKCKFNLDPHLYTTVRPNYEWYLLRRPWKGNGYYYDAVEVNAEWSSDHAKRPDNRLRPDQLIVLKGTKDEVRQRVGEIQQECL
ncbi:MAG: hypothetical protein WBH85_01345 [Thermoanaerobaculia bacterium]